MAKNISKLIHGNVNPYDNLPSVREDQQGWASTGKSFEEIFEKIKPKTVIEVGTWKGASAINMAKLAEKNEIPADEFELVCIDTFLGSVEHHTKMNTFNVPDLTDTDGSSHKINGRPKIYETFLSNIVRNNLTDVITPFPIDSMNGGLCLTHWKIQADLIYIDAAHDFESVRSDFMIYNPILRNGGYILIDDWHHDPIKKAAKDIFGDKVFDFHGKGAWIK